MKKIILTCFILGLSTTAFAAESLESKVVCLAKINSKSQAFTYNLKKQALAVSADGLSALVILAKIGNAISASVSIEVDSAPTIITTGYMRVPSRAESTNEHGQPSMMAVADLGDAGQISAFCTLK